ncbi:hypothetical protein RND81_12G068300 [Saponaria officinalis]|uniref:Hexosyltransferase n=1 Tax=Saponaria officinalis TaxID=3572 RepID=A0AAW1H7G5_SAPOF
MYALKSWDPNPPTSKPPKWLEAIRGAHLTHQRPLKVVSYNVTWKKLFPEWINESPSDKCPTIPMPNQRKYIGLDVVVAKLPCGERSYDNGSREKVGIRDDVYGVFIAKCEPMLEIFKCDDLVWHGGSYWVYIHHIQKLREIISMPLGTCELAHPYIGTLEAYVTVLHSSETYVCGAIALAQSILLTNTTKDLILLADHTISDHSIKGLQSAGWKTKRIRRIRSPKANSNAYNKWNYSKLRVWQLTEYDKVMFIDSDFIVLQNIDHFFDYPQFSAGPKDKWLFNSGIMVLEPSECFFRTLMSKRDPIMMSSIEDGVSYNGGDQGYLNEVLTWWHRLTRKLTFMKFYVHEGGNRSVPIDRYTIHYLGFKPCNDVHARWWGVYDTLPKELQKYCGMTKQLKNGLHRRRVEAQKVDLNDGHWKIEIKDPRQQI